jgi:hypothetical protein
LFESNVNYRFEPVIQSDISIVCLASGRDLPGQFALSWAPKHQSTLSDARLQVYGALSSGRTLLTMTFASAYLTGPLFGAQMPTLLNSEQVGIIERLATRSYHPFETGRPLLAHLDK